MKYDENKRKQIYVDAVKCWGEMAQFDQFIEESCELIVAINKYKRKKFFGEYRKYTSNYYRNRKNWYSKLRL